MAISYVGGQTASVAASIATNTTINFALTGGLAATPAAGDLVVVAYAAGSTADRTLTVQSAGYTYVADVYGNDSYDANLRVAYKILTSAETSVVVGPTLATADSGVVAIQVYRGVDPATPLDVAAVTNTFANAGSPTPPAITPVTAAAVVVCAAATASTGGGTYSAPGDLSGFIQATNTAATNDVTAGMGYAFWAGSGAFTPAIWTFTPSAATQSRVAVSLALRPHVAQPATGSADGTLELTATATGAAPVQGAAEAPLDLSGSGTGSTFSGALVSATAATGSGTSPTVTPAQAPTPGNLLLLIGGGDKAHSSESGPAGWTPLLQTLSLTGSNLSVFWRLADGSETGPISMTLSSSLLWQLSVLEFAGPWAASQPAASAVTANNTQSKTIAVGPTGTFEARPHLALAILTVDSLSSAADGAVFTGGFGVIHDVRSGVNSGCPPLFVASKVVTDGTAQSTTISYEQIVDERVGALLVFASGSGPEGPGAVTGVASGSLDLSGTAAGVASAAGAAAGTLTPSGSASGAAPAKGAASGSVDLSASASGTSPAKASGAGSFDLSGSAAGAAAAKGAGAGSVTVSGAAQGTTQPAGPAAGQASATLDVAGAAAGKAFAAGQAGGSLGLSGAAAGKAPASGAASGATSLAGAAVGVAPAAGPAAGGVGFTGSADGAAPAAGAAAAGIELAADATLTAADPSVPGVAVIVAAGRWRNRTHDGCWRARRAAGRWLHRTAAGQWRTA